LTKHFCDHEKLFVAVGDQHNTAHNDINVVKKQTTIEILEDNLTIARTHNKGQRYTTFPKEMVKLKTKYNHHRSTHT